MQMEDEQQQPSILVSPAKEREGPLYAILHSTPIAPARRQSIVTLHPPESIKNSAPSDSAITISPSQQNGNTAVDAGPSS